MNNLPAGLAWPGKHVVGTSSPVVQIVNWIELFFTAKPEPDIATDQATACGLLAANHLLQVMAACGLLNISGKPSAEVSLLRALEDALDCFAAVTLVEGAAEEWQQGKLKPSEAAKKWTFLYEAEFSDDGMKPGEYRKMARGMFNKYSHATYELCLWELYLRPTPHPDTGAQGYIPEINRTGMVIESNAHAIDAHLTAHLLEFTELLEKAYSKAIRLNPDEFAKFKQLQAAVIEIMETHNEHGCQDVRTPPELRRAGVA